MLRHTTTKTINMPTAECARCLLDPETVLGASKYTYTVKRIGDGIYEAVFKWVKMGITRFYKVRFIVKRGREEVVYESTKGSDHWMRLEFRLQQAGEATRLTVNAEMKAGIMASLLGKRDYAAFIDELVESGIRRTLSKITGESQAIAGGNGRVSCSSCLLYDPDRGYCYRMSKTVQDGECKGRYYIDKRLVAREAGGLKT
ncbi:MAG: SRPBCC family protein [Desulfurococcales archaeon]|nr:SRPBCC family protein [Desulfurococcales archaeon]